MDCPFRCGENFADKAEIAAHTGDNGSCPLAPVQCVFKGIGNGGCPAKPQRRFLEAHLTRSSATHQRLLLDGFHQLRQGQTQLQAQVERLAAAHASGGGGAVKVSSRPSSARRSAPPDAIQELSDGLATVQSNITALSSQLGDVSGHCTRLHGEVSTNRHNLHKLQMTPVPVAASAATSAADCSRCDTLAVELQQLRGIVLDMAGSAKPCSKWCVQVDVRMHGDGRLELVGNPSSPCHWSGPTGCGHQVYTSCALKTLAQLIGHRAAPNQVGLAELAINVIASSSDWPENAQQLCVAYPNTLLSMTQSAVMTLPPASTVVSSVSNADAADDRAESMQSPKRYTLQTVGIPILLPPEAELGATLDWSYEVQLCAVWAHKTA
eukprot:scpid72379/ scgid17035/ 